MIEKERIAIMIKDIERHFSDMSSIHIENKSCLGEPEKKHAVSMLVFSIMNRALDIANEIMSGSALPAPASYRDSFDILKNAKIISSGTAENMAWLVRYRNIIAHE